METRNLRAEELARALVNPAAVFADPFDVTEDETIPPSVRIEILLRWEYDVREQEVAQEENMSGEPAVGLQRVHAALHALGAKPDTGRAPPTKQGGM